MSAIDQAYIREVRQLKTDILTTEPCRQPLLLLFKSNDPFATVSLTHSLTLTILVSRNLFHSVWYASSETYCRQ